MEALIKTSPAVLWEKKSLAEVLSDVNRDQMER